MYTPYTTARNFKSLVTALLCIVIFAPCAFSQQHVLPQPRHFKLQPGSVTPWQLSHTSRGGHGHSNMKSLGDTTDMLDYSTYNEIIANELNITYNGSWNTTTPQILGTELTSFLTPANADNGDVSFAQVIFDSLAFASFADQSTYSLPLSGATVTLDSLAIFMGISGDTTAGDGTMAHDSLVITIYPVNDTVVSSTPAATIVNAGYTGLSQFFTGTTPGYMKCVVLPVSLTFNPGQSFAVKLTYLNKDTSSHCTISYSYADSCQTIVYDGVTYASPAYPSPFVGNSSWGSIDSTGVNSASVININNEYTYNLAGIPSHCSYLYMQNWEILAMVTVEVPYSTVIQASQTTACEGSTVNLNALVYGTDSANITYNWAVSAGGVLLGANSQAASVTVPANITNNVTVTLTVNDGSGNVSDSIVIINCHLNVAPGGIQTVCIGSNIILQPAVTGGTPPYAYQWQASAGTLSCTNCTNPSATVSQNTVYTVTVTDAAQATATSSFTYGVNGTSNDVQFTVSNTGIGCSSQSDTTTVTVTGGTAPYTFNWGNNIASTGASSPQSYYYGLPGGQQIISVTDANGCVSAVFDTIINLGPAISFVRAVEPGCPNASTGEIFTSVTGGTPPYTYNWSNYSGNDSIVNIPPGYYQLVVTDAHGCTAIFNYGLNSVQDYDYYVYMNPTGPNCGQAGSVTTTVTGGIPPYSYIWSNAATTANISIVSGGDYAVTITDALGCQTSGDAYVYSNCVSYINGTAFYDSTGNCVLAGNPPLQGLYVVATSSVGDEFYGYTDDNGNYSIPVGDTGTYSLIAQAYSSICGNFTFCGNSNQTVYLPVLGDSSNNNNIGFTSSSGFNLGIHPGWTSADPGFIKQYWVFYYNSSFTPYNGPATIIFNYDPNLIYLYTDEIPAPSLDSIAHTLTWSVDSVPNINDNNWDRLDAYFQVPATLSLNYLLHSTFTILPMVGDCDTTDNQYTYTDLVTGSHDPNEKTVSPSGPVTADDSVLTYTIHFQNTGTDSTHFVVIKDTLSSNLNPATVRNIASSDAYKAFSISGNGILTWTFDPLRIVDSTTNPAGSKRFIMFTVHKKPGLPLGTTINNTASVYFDYNTPVVTNTVSDTEAAPLYISEVSNSNNITVKAFPNPFNDVTHIVVTGINQKFGFELYDVTGRLQQSIPSIDNNQFDVHRGQLANGVYLYRILETGKPAAHGKLVIE